MTARRGHSGGMFRGPGTESNASRGRCQVSFFLTTAAIFKTDADGLRIYSLFHTHHTLKPTLSTYMLADTYANKQGSGSWSRAPPLRSTPYGALRV